MYSHMCVSVRYKCEYMWDVLTCVWCGIPMYTYVLCAHTSDVCVIHHTHVRCHWPYSHMRDAGIHTCEMHISGRYTYVCAYIYLVGIHMCVSTCTHTCEMRLTILTHERDVWVWAIYDIYCTCFQTGANIRDAAIWCMLYMYICIYVYKCMYQ